MATIAPRRSPYTDTIALVIADEHATDLTTLALIEEIMRDNRSGLDSLTTDQFRSEANAILTELKADQETARLLLDAYGWTYPEWLAAK